ncbi:hypothetical protein HAX54_004661 [Datura stramonium]|uniref:Uncharacterized protein n=1 Tax=Datura stramonium TaxID=4076 RepID=A0ABS8T8L4_DATST|nr:hypothetical protein [Datura stramonium]
MNKIWEKRGGKRCYVYKYYDSDWADSNVYERFSSGMSRNIPKLTVLSTDLGILELKGDLLELTQMVKDHDILLDTWKKDEPYSFSNEIGDECEGKGVSHEKRHSKSKKH